jgi:hypothetical protein
MGRYLKMHPFVVTVSVLCGVELLGDRLSANFGRLTQRAFPLNRLRNHRERLLSGVRLRRFWLV